MLFWGWWLAQFLPFFGVFCPQAKRGLRFRQTKSAPISGNFFKCKKPKTHHAKNCRKLSKRRISAILINWRKVGKIMTNSPKWKVCRDCGYEPDYKTTTMSCSKCKNGLLRVKRSR